MKGPKILDDLSLSSVHQNLFHQGLEEDFFSQTPISPFSLRKIDPATKRFKTPKSFSRATSKSPTTSPKLPPPQPVKPRNFMFQLKKIGWVKKAIQRFRQNSAFRRPDQLKKVHYQLLGDRVIGSKSSVISPQNQFRTLKTLKGATTWVKKGFKNLPIINPNDRFKLFWDLFIMILILVQMFLLSVEVAFQPDHAMTSDFQIFKILSILIFFLDILMKFKTSFYEHGSLMKNHRKIRENYIKKAIVTDTASLIALIVNYATPAKWIGLLFFLHGKTVKRLMSNFENRLNFGDYFDLLSVTGKLLFIAHIYACIWHYISFRQRTETDLTWLTVTGLEGADWKVRYVYACYWALTTMVTVGYGDITPQNMDEIVFCVFTLVSGCLVSGYCLNKIGSSLSKIEERDRELKCNIRIMDTYMREHNINTDLKARALKYLEFTWKLERKHLEKEQMLLEQLPENLKKELLFEANGKALQQFEILKSNFKQEIIDRLSFSLKATQYSPKEIIYTKNQFEDNEQSLFMVAAGEVEVLMNDSNVLKTIKKSQTFGELEFFLNQPYHETVRSTTFTTVFKLNRRAFLDILRQSSDQYEIFCQIQDKIAFYQDYSSLCSPCFSCQQAHPLPLCPIVNYIPNKSSLILRLNYTRPQERLSQARRRVRSAIFDNTLSHFQKVKTNAFRIRFDPSVMNVFKSFEEPATMEAENQSLPSRAQSCHEFTAKNKIELPKIRSMQHLELRPKTKNCIPGKQASLEEFESKKTRDSVWKKVKESQSKHNLQSLLNEQRQHSIEKEIENEDLKNEYTESHSSNANINCGPLQKEATKSEEVVSIFSSKKVNFNVIENINTHLLNKTEEIENVNISKEIEKESFTTKLEQVDKKIDQMPNVSVFAKNARLPTKRNILLFEKVLGECSCQNEMTKNNSNNNTANNNTTLNILNNIGNIISMTKDNSVNASNNNERKNLFWYDFDVMKNFANYFIEGNPKNVEIKIRSKRRMTVKKNSKVRASACRQGV